jgi:hypothetical protein
MWHPIRKYWLPFAVTFAIILIGSGAFIAQAGRDDSPSAQDSPAVKKPDPPLNLTDDELREVVQVLNLYTLDKDLGLTDDQLVHVLPKWRGLTEMRREFWHDRKHRVDALRQALDAHQSDPANADETALDVDVDSFHQVDSEFWGQHAALRFSLLDLLTPAQKVAFILLEGEQGSRSRRVMRALRRINRSPQPELLSEAPSGKDAEASTVAAKD